MAQLSNTRTLTILAQDPGVRFGGPQGPLAFERVQVPAENLGAGPTGYRVKVVDFDASSNLLYQDEVYASGSPRAGEGFRSDGDPFEYKGDASPESLRAFEQSVLANPNFHAQQVYAIVMRTLARFEFALGRRVPWSFGGHQLNVIPHAFAEANAYYSEQDQALFFGYFPGRSGALVFTCLSHDVVAHETTHALLDGLRTRFTEASTPDQAAFHEAFADIVALLSVFSLPAVVSAGLSGAVEAAAHAGKIPLIDGSLLTMDALCHSILTGIGKQFGQETAVTGDEVSEVRGAALRRSVEMEPNADYMTSPSYQEAHHRGEILVAAFMRSFLKLWIDRIQGLGTFGDNLYNRDMVVEEGAKTADHLLTMAIRALDYSPPTDMDFSAYLASLLTADAELYVEDSHNYRAAIRKTFESYGIALPVLDCQAEAGTWCPFDPAIPITYARTNFESMLRDKDEVFRFIWENRDALEISERVPITVDSVRPSTRHAPDGFIVKETIVTYVQVLDMFAAECKALLGFERPEGMPTTQRLQVFGGGAIVFDQYGRIKYHIPHRLRDMERQRRRLEYLAAIGATAPRRDARDRFAALHRARAEG
jgi:hypothetical protein